MQRLLNGFRFLPVSKFCFPFTLVTLSTHYLGILFLTLTTIDPFSVYKFIKNCISWSNFFFSINIRCRVKRGLLNTSIAVRREMLACCFMQTLVIVGLQYTAKIIKTIFVVLYCCIKGFSSLLPFLYPIVCIAWIALTIKNI